MATVNITVRTSTMKNPIRLLKQFYFHFTTQKSNHPVYYRISSIDIETQTAMLHLIQKNIFFKLSLSTIISTSQIIEGLSCQHACWVGTYYGKLRMMNLKRNSPTKPSRKSRYLLKHKYGQYKIICENRNGTVDCLHVKTGQIININPLSIATDDIFIKRFDATQACYIGILAGISMTKEIKPTAKKVVPYLRIVK